MKKYLILIVYMAMVLLNTNAQVSISMDCTAEPDASAMLDVQSTTQGLLVPRIQQLNSITNPATGLLIFDVNRNDYYYYNGSEWLPMNQADGDAWAVDGEDIVSAIGRNGNTGIGTLTPGAQLEIRGRLWITSTGQSVFLGERAGQNDDLSDNANIFIGYDAGRSNVDGYKSVAIGRGALASTQSGYYNIALGVDALTQNTSGYCNVAVGAYSLRRNHTGVGNTGAGGYSLRNNQSGDHNVGFGKHSLDQNTAGDNNTAAGEDAIYSNQTGVNNTGIGRASLYHTTADNNIALGRNAGDNITSGSRNIIIGALVTAASATNDDQLNIGDLIRGDLTTGYIGVMAAPTATLDLTGALRLQASSTPASADAGDIYFDGTNLWGYNGTSWLQLDNCAPCLK